MVHWQRWMAGAGVLLFITSITARAGSKEDPARALAKKIDQHVNHGLRKAKVEPTAVADEAEFLRRVNLDLAGRIPSLAEARAFLGDKKADRRQRLIDELLSRPVYASHFTNVWRAAWMPEAGGSIQNLLITAGFERWLRTQLQAGVPYDRMVRNVLTMPIANKQSGFFEVELFTDQGRSEPTPIAFYMAKDNKPEELAAATARLFLGAKVECAQCHNHPFADWKRDEFWSFAAFFAGIKAQRREEFSIPNGETIDKRDIAIPGAESKVIAARFLDGSKPEFKSGTSSRVTLAAWMTAPDNPYFARAAVNRLWAYFFGAGLIDPIDEMIGMDIKASHPELLDELARAFVANSFDLKFLIRAITNSQAYQRTSAGLNTKQGKSQLFARMPLRGLRPEQLFDSVAQATGYQEGKTGGLAQFFVGKNSPRDDFLTRFTNGGDKITDAQISILQALAMMNGRLIADATSLQKSETLAGVADAPFLDTAGRVEVLFLAALSRTPRPDETKRFVAYVDQGGAAQSSEVNAEQYNRALADVFWVLLNSSEFIFNH
jgi:hypothetical protein